MSHPPSVAYWSELTARLRAAGVPDGTIITAEDAERIYPKAQWLTRAAFQPQQGDHWEHAGGPYMVNLDAWTRFYQALNRQA